MLLVIDVNKGMQTQTGECIVIGEITSEKMIIVLNKIDLIAEDEREEQIEKMKKKLRKALQTSRFADCPMIALASAVGGRKVVAAKEGIHSDSSSIRRVERNVPDTMGISALINMIQSHLSLPQRHTHLPFYYAIDHCFAIKGHGTVLTGTVLSGCIQPGKEIELPYLHMTRKVKSMQMFRTSVNSAKQGDRVGICVTNLDPKLIERGIAVSPNSVPLLRNVICLIKKVRFFKLACKSGMKVPAYLHTYKHT